MPANLSDGTRQQGRLLSGKNNNPCLGGSQSTLPLFFYLSSPQPGPHLPGSVELSGGNDRQGIHFNLVRKHQTNETPNQWKELTKVVNAIIADSWVSFGERTNLGRSKNLMRHETKKKQEENSLKPAWTLEAVCQPGWESMEDRRIFFHLLLLIIVSLLLLATPSLLQHREKVFLGDFFCFLINSSHPATAFSICSWRQVG